MDDIIFTAPDGCPIQGLLQHDDATWRVFWTSEEADAIDYVADGPDGADWNTVEWHDEAVYVDNNGTYWFAHHLIRAGAKEAADDVIALMLDEVVWQRRAHLARELSLTFDHIEQAADNRKWRGEAKVFLHNARQARFGWQHAHTGRESV
jgi:hypothetical protein